MRTTRKRPASRSATFFHDRPSSRPGWMMRMTGPWPSSNARTSVPSAETAVIIATPTRRRARLSRAYRCRRCRACASSPRRAGRPHGERVSRSATHTDRRGDHLRILHKHAVRLAPRNHSFAARRTSGLPGRRARLALVGGRPAHGARRGLGDGASPSTPRPPGAAGRRSPRPLLRGRRSGRHRA
jgi:hypothetical protein